MMRYESKSLDLDRKANTLKSNSPLYIYRPKYLLQPTICPWASQVVQW